MHCIHISASFKHEPHGYHLTNSTYILMYIYIYVYIYIYIKTHTLPSFLYPQTSPFPMYIYIQMRNHSTADKQTLFFWAKKTLALLVFARTCMSARMRKSTEWSQLLRRNWTRDSWVEWAGREDQGEAELSSF